MAISSENDVVFLLGAGASVDAGCLTVKDLTSQFPDWASRSGAPVPVLKAYEWLRATLAGLTAVSSGHRQLDIELVLEAIERIGAREQDPLSAFVLDRGWIKSLSKHADVLPELGRVIRDYIREKCELNADAVRYFRFLVDYAQHRPRGLDVFTLNYDCAVELACDEARVPYTDGFALSWEPELFDDHRYRVRLHKLHGSLIWYETAPPSSQLVRIPITYERTQRIRFLGATDVAATLVYPTAPKEQHVEPYSTLMARLRQKLRDTRLLVAIGCSFRDHYIKEVVSEALHQNAALRLVVVDLYPYEVLTNSDASVRKGRPFSSSKLKTHLVARTAKDALADGWIMQRLSALRATAEATDRYVSERLEASVEARSQSASIALDLAIGNRDIATIARLFRLDDAPYLRGYTIIRVGQTLDALGAALIALETAPTGDDETVARSIINALSPLCRLAAVPNGGSLIGRAQGWRDRNEAREGFSSARHVAQVAQRALTEVSAELRWISGKKGRELVDGLVDDFDALVQYYNAASNRPTCTRLMSWDGRNQREEKWLWHCDDAQANERARKRISNAGARHYLHTEKVLADRFSVLLGPDPE